MATALIGVEVGLLKGRDTLRWAMEAIQQFGELMAVSTVVQEGVSSERPSLRMVAKVSLAVEPMSAVAHLNAIEREYSEKIKIIESIRLFLLAYDQIVSLTPTLTLPHPCLTQDSAWLYCSWEIWRTYRHPVLDTILEKLVDSSSVATVEFFCQGKAIISKPG